MKTPVVTNENFRFKAQVRHYHRSANGLATWDDWVEPGQCRSKSKPDMRPWLVFLGAMVIAFSVTGVIVGFLCMAGPA